MRSNHVSLKNTPRTFQSCVEGEEYNNFNARLNFDGSDIRFLARHVLRHITIIIVVIIFAATNIYDFAPAAERLSSVQ